MDLLSAIADLVGVVTGICFFVGAARSYLKRSKASRDGQSDKKNEKSDASTDRDAAE